MPTQEYVIAQGVVGGLRITHIARIEALHTNGIEKSTAPPKRTRRTQRWDEGAIAKLLAMVKGGTPNREIARQFNLKDTSVAPLISKMRSKGHDLPRKRELTSTVPTESK